MSDKFYKNNPTDRTMWVNDFSAVGEFQFSLDGRKIYNLFADYPHNMTADEVRIFDRENPQWAAYFSDRR